MKKCRPGGLNFFYNKLQNYRHQFADTNSMRRLIIVLFIAAGMTAALAAQAPETMSFRQEGMASWYGGEFDGRPTASGEIFNSNLFTAAHPSLPFGTVLTVTNVQNGRQVTVRVNDRGPFAADRILDLSRIAAEALDMLTVGTTFVIVEGAVLVSPAQPPVLQAPALQVVQPPLPPAPPPPAPAATPVPTAVFPAPPALLRGTVPDPAGANLYRIQVGSYQVPRNAVVSFERLREFGLDPAYERNEDFYRVVLAGVRAVDIPAIAQTLGNAGFREVIVRRETGY